MKRSGSTPLTVLALILTFSFPLKGAFAASSAEAAAADALVDSALSGEPVSAQQGVATVKANPAVVSAALNGLGSMQGVVTPDQTDHSARLYDLKGTVKVAKKGSEAWTKARKGLILQAGDVLLTGKKSSASVTFDEGYWNVVEIRENTKAVFESIEPTNIKLEDGSIFNMFDGLPEGSSWKVSTPTAVAAVRGTEFFVNYTAANGELISATFDVPEDKSLISLIDILPDGSEGKSVDVPQENQINLNENQEPDASLLKNIDPEILKIFKKILDKVLALRRKGRILPPTGAEDIQNITQDALKDTVPQLDQRQDTGNNPPSEEEPSEPTNPDPGSGNELPAGGEGQGQGEGEGEGPGPYR